MNQHRFTLSAAACLLVLATGSRAAVVIDNLTLGSQSFSQTVSGPTATGFFGINPFPDRQVAFSFTTGSADTYLTELVFAISIGKAILDPIQWTLSTGSSVPGGTDPQVIGSVTPASSSPTSQLLTLVPGTTIRLEGNTTYWMHITVPAGAAVYSFQNTTSQVIDPGWALGNTWSWFPGSAWSELDSGPQARIRMTVEAVPEPSVLLLGACGFVILLRRRR